MSDDHASLTTPQRYPVRVEGRLEPGLSRGLWLVKWLLLVPHVVVLACLWVAFAATTVVAWFAILITGRYPPGIFRFNLGVLRWTWRVSFYGYSALGTDRYPPFTLADVPDYPARLDVAYPQHLSRGLIFVKSWLLAIPHYLVVGLFVGGTGTLVLRDTAAGPVSSGGLVALLLCIAGVMLLVRGRYPQGIFDTVLGMDRWAIRVIAYAALMTDAYPPFRLDQGGSEPPPPPDSPPPRHLRSHRPGAATAGTGVAPLSHDGASRQSSSVFPTASGQQMASANDTSSSTRSADQTRLSAHHGVDAASWRDRRATGMMMSITRPGPGRPDPSSAPVERERRRPAGAAPVMCTGHGRPDSASASPGTARLLAAPLPEATSVDTPPGVDLPSGTVTPLAGVPMDLSGAPTDVLSEAMGRHPTALGCHLDIYLAAVARELRAGGVLTGTPQRSDPADRLIGSIVVDCTALRLEAWTPDDETGTEARSLGGALHPGRPAPVVATWDEYTGWCVGLHHDPTHSSQRYLHPGALLPDPTVVADFVVGLALGHPIGATQPITPTGPGRPPLHACP